MKSYETVKVEREEGIAWVILNRPEKRNAMSPQLHFEMVDVLNRLEEDDGTRVLVLTGAGKSWCAGQDLQRYFRELEDRPAERRRAEWATHEWRWRGLSRFPKPTIAMVNGYCFGGAFTQLVACDFAVADEDALFGLSEINFGTFPGGLVSRVILDAMAFRKAVYYSLTGDTFDGRQAEAMGLVTCSVPRNRLREETVKLAKKLMKKNPRALQAAKEVLHHSRHMGYREAEDYLRAKSVALRASDPGGGRNEGIRQFLDEKKYRPGLGPYDFQG